MRNDIVEGSRGLKYVCFCVRKGHQENSTTQIARQTSVSRDTRQVDADSGDVIEARQPDNAGFDTGGYTDSENIDGRYIVKAIIVSFSKSKQDSLSVTKNQHFQSFGTPRQ